MQVIFYVIMCIETYFDVMYMYSICAVLTSNYVPLLTEDICQILCECFAYQKPLSSEYGIQATQQRLLIFTIHGANI